MSTSKQDQIKALALSVIALFALCGCSSLGPSRAWKTVTEAKLPGRGDPAQSDAYAVRLHELLNEKGIENRIVRFPMDEASVAARGESSPSRARTAVVYRNDQSPKNPYWLMDNTRGTPLWLSDEPLAQQLHIADASSRAQSNTGRIAQTQKLQTLADRSSRPVFTSPRRDREQQIAQQDEELEPIAEAPLEVDWNVAFKKAHGTSYDPNSPLDRRKLAALKAQNSRHLEAREQKRPANSASKPDRRSEHSSDSPPTNQRPTNLGRKLTSGDIYDPQSGRVKTFSSERALVATLSVVRSIPEFPVRSELLLEVPPTKPSPVARSRRAKKQRVARREVAPCHWVQTTLLTA